MAGETGKCIAMQDDSRHARVCLGPCMPSSLALQKLSFEWKIFLTFDLLLPRFFFPGGPESIPSPWEEAE